MISRGILRRRRLQFQKFFCFLYPRKITRLSNIYNSRNYICLLDIIRPGTKYSSTTVEIIFVFQTCCDCAKGSLSTTVEIIFVFQTRLLGCSLMDLQQQKLYLSFRLHLLKIKFKASTTVEIIFVFQTCTRCSFVVQIYNSRNYICLLDRTHKKMTRNIYNSRNYICLLDYKISRQSHRSTTVEIIFVFQTLRKARMTHKIYNSRNYICLLDTDLLLFQETDLQQQKLYLSFRPATGLKGYKVSTTVEIIFVFQTRKHTEVNELSTTVEIIFVFQTFRTWGTPLISTTVEIIFVFQTCVGDKPSYISTTVEIIFVFQTFAQPVLQQEIYNSRNYICLLDIKLIKLIKIHLQQQKLYLSFRLCIGEQQ